MSNQSGRTYGLPYEFDVLVNGKTVDKFVHPEDGRTFIEGRKKSEFTLRIKNNTPKRIMVLCSVDGLSVMTGKTASAKKGGGYIVGGHEVVTIPGWRLNNSAIAKFIFSSKGQSYANTKETPEPKNVGVIGCLVYREKEQVRLSFMKGTTVTTTPCAYTEERPRGIRYGAARGRPRGPGGQSVHSGDDDYGTLDCMESDDLAGEFLGGQKMKGGRMVNERRKPRKNKQHLGTGFGREEEHQVDVVHFVNEPVAAESYAIYYDDRKGLAEKGIDTRRHRVTAVPNPFPGDEVGATPPAGWRG